MSGKPMVQLEPGQIIRRKQSSAGNVTHYNKRFRKQGRLDYFAFQHISPDGAIYIYIVREEQ